MKFLFKILLLIFSLGLVVSCAQTITNGSSFLDDLFSNKTNNNSSEYIKDYDSDISENLDNSISFYDNDSGSYLHNIHITSGYETSSNINRYVDFTFSIVSDYNKRYRFDTFTDYIGDYLDDNDISCILFNLNNAFYLTNDDSQSFNYLFFNSEKFYCVDENYYAFFAINPHNYDIDDFHFSFMFEDFVEEISNIDFNNNDNNDSYLHTISLVSSVNNYFSNRPNYTDYDNKYMDTDYYVYFCFVSSFDDEINNFNDLINYLLSIYNDSDIYINASGYIDIEDNYIGDDIDNTNHIEITKIKFDGEKIQLRDDNYSYGYYDYYNGLKTYINYNYNSFDYVVEDWSSTVIDYVELAN